MNEKIDSSNVRSASEDKGRRSPAPSTSTLVSTGDIGGVDPAYRQKSEILNGALTQIGMGRYQWQLFFLAGLGWFADNIWLQGMLYKVEF